MVKQILTVSAWRVESRESRDFCGFSAKRKRSNDIAERHAVCLLSTIEAVHLPETTPVRLREVCPSDAASTIEKQFRHGGEFGSYCSSLYRCSARRCCLRTGYRCACSRRRGCELVVVPANAGTPSLRSRGVAPLLPHHASQRTPCLWIPAFAGMTRHSAAVAICPRRSNTTSPPRMVRSQRASISTCSGATLNTSWLSTAISASWPATRRPTLFSANCV